RSRVARPPGTRGPPTRDATNATRADGSAESGAQQIAGIAREEAGGNESSGRFAAHRQEKIVCSRDRREAAFGTGALILARRILNFAASAGVTNAPSCQSHSGAQVRQVQR